MDPRECRSDDAIFVYPVVDVQDTTNVSFVKCRFFVRRHECSYIFGILSFEGRTRGMWKRMFTQMILEMNLLKSEAYDLQFNCPKSYNPVGCDSRWVFSFNQVRSPHLWNVPSRSNSDPKRSAVY